MSSKRKFRRALNRRFQKELRQLLVRLGWTAKQLSSHLGIPHRTMLNWLAGSACPQAPRLKEVCGKIGWRYEELFQGESLADELFEEDYLNFQKLTHRYLRLQVKDPLEAWAHIPLAAALVHVDLEASGFPCRTITDYQFGARIEFDGSKQVALQVHVIYGRGLVVSWLDDQGLTRETRELSEASLKIIKANLSDVAGL